jgi:hypothetical protein
MHGRIVGRSLSEPSLHLRDIQRDTGAGLRYVAFGDSWPAGAHCNGCITFAELWADDIEKQTRKSVEFTDLTGAKERSSAESKTSASRLESLKTDEHTRAVVRDADIILIATGPNEMEVTDQPLRDGSCGPKDNYGCIRALGRTWAKNFDAVLVEIDKLRQGRPTAIRLVNAANPFLSDPAMSEGLPDNFASSGGALIFRLLTEAVCDAAAAHHAKCVDVGPLLNGPKLDQAVDENSPESMRKIADALNATGLAEVG